jgi:hypothetical protein
MQKFAAKFLISRLLTRRGWRIVDRRWTKRELRLLGVETLLARNPAYEADDGPLSEDYLAALRKDAAVHFPAVALLSRKHLFEAPEDLPVQERNLDFP